MPPVRKSTRPVRLTDKLKDYMGKDCKMGKKGKGIPTGSRSFVSSVHDISKGRKKMIFHSRPKVELLKHSLLDEADSSVKNLKFPKVLLHPLKQSQLPKEKSIITVSSRPKVFSPSVVLSKEDKENITSSSLLRGETSARSPILVKSTTGKGTTIVFRNDRLIAPHSVKSPPKLLTITSKKPEDNLEELSPPDTPSDDFKSGELEESADEQPENVLSDYGDSSDRRKSRRAPKPSEKWKDYITAAQKENDVDETPPSFHMPRKRGRPKKGRFSVLVQNFDDDHSSSGHELDFYEASDSNESFPDNMASFHSAEGHSHNSEELDRLKKDWDDEDDASEGEGAGEDELAFDTVVESVQKTPIKKLSPSKPTVFLSSPDSKKVPEKSTSKIFTIGKKDGRGRKKKSESIAGIRPVFTVEKLPSSKAINESEDAILKPVLKKMIGVGSEVANTLNKSLKNKENGRFFATSFDKRFKLFLSSLPMKVEGDLTEKESAKICTWLDEEQKDRKTQQHIMLDNMRVSHDANMALYTQILDMLESM